MSAVELNAKERQQLLSVLREMDDTTASERRIDRRRKVLVNLWIRKIRKAKEGAESGAGGGGGVDFFKGAVVNVATQGVGLRVPRPVASGDKLLLPLRFREGGGWLVLCEVRNCRRLESGEFRVGAKFLDRIDDPEGDAQVPMDWVL